MKENDGGRQMKNKKDIQTNNKQSRAKQKTKSPRKGTRIRGLLIIHTIKNPIKTLNWKP